VSTSADLLLLPLREAVDAAAGVGRQVTIDVLAPPYACAGRGHLRVVRVLERPDGLALTAAYDAYERL
jgi:hypothetical protein